MRAWPILAVASKCHVEDSLVRASELGSFQGIDSVLIYNLDTLNRAMNMDYAAISPEDLVRACLGSGNQLAWAEFVRRFHPLIARVVLRVASQWGDASRQIVDDLIQETYLKLCEDKGRLLRTFESRHEGAIYGYIKTFTANLVHDHFKGSRSKKRGGGSSTTDLHDDETQCATDGSAKAVSAMERNILLHQVDVCLRAIVSGGDAQRDRKIFWLYYRTGLTAGAIASMPGIGLTTKGVESVLLRVTRQVRDSLSQAAPSGSVGPEKGIRQAESL
jgi:RNA polymerase sigma-70 factor (ECF subfamily)